MSGTCRTLGSRVPRVCPLLTRQTDYWRVSPRSVVQHDARHTAAAPTLPFFAGLVDRFTAAFRRASQWDWTSLPPAFRAAVRLAAYCFERVFGLVIVRRYQASSAASGQNKTEA